MIQKPVWLPQIVSVNGEWLEILARLYKIFEQDFKHTQLRFQGILVWWDRGILQGGTYEEGFWHLITKGDPENRLFEPRRAERLPWCGPTISHSDDKSVKVWDFRESNRHIRTYIWLHDWDYVIILEKRKHRKGPIAFLVTAFYVEGDSNRRSLSGKFQKREGL
jgi:hypothetical protein